MLIAEWKSSASANSHWSCDASSCPTVVLPAPETPIRMMTTLPPPGLFHSESTGKIQTGEHEQGRSRLCLFWGVRGCGLHRRRWFGHGGRLCCTIEDTAVQAIESE